MGDVLGRERELARRAQFLAEARVGLRVLTLEGEAGIGKTTVWDAAVADARQAGFRVLSARPAETEAKLELSAVADLVETVPPAVVASLPAPQRHAVEVALLRSDPGEDAPGARTIATAVRGILETLAAAGPLLVAVDDVQWLDRASATVLGFALRRLGGTPGGWLLARRAGLPTLLAPERLLGNGVADTLTLGPLDVQAMHGLLTARLDRPLARPALVRVHQTAGGNPLYALEIARELQRADAVGPVLPAPAHLRDLVARRVRSLPPATREALLTAAAMPVPTTAVVDAEALAPAEDEEIVTVGPDGQVTFRHPLYASAVYGTASLRRRRVVHARLASLAADEEERAQHLAAATATPEGAIAARIEAGAARARRRGAWGAAAALLERARELTPDDDRGAACRRGLAAAEHHAHAGDRVRARELLEALDAGGLAPAVRARALVLLGQIAINDDKFDEARRVLASALEHAGDARTLTEIEVGLAYVCANQWDFAGAAAHSHRALALAERAGVRGLVAIALGFCAMYDFLCGGGADREKAERALALEDPELVMPGNWSPSTVVGALALYLGRYDEARARLRAVWEHASAVGDESDLAFVVLWLSWLEVRAGDLAEAGRLAREGAALASLTGSTSIHAWLLAQQALVHAHTGDAEATRRLCEESWVAVAHFGNALSGIWIAAANPVLELSLGSAEAAWRACEPLVRGLEREGLGEPVVAFFLGDALEALIAIGEAERAAPLVEALSDRGRELDRAWAIAVGARCRALLLAARGDLDAAAEAVERALAEQPRLGMPFEHARTLLVAGAIARRRRRRSAAKAAFERAEALFAELGAELWRARAAEEAGRVGLRRGAGDAVTATERRVAELAAQGRTNREIAGTLHMSPKTVEAHLARVYRKLEIASRAELGARMAVGAPVQT
jgi:DNA-binding CsgD family transcriptional regulator